MNCKKCSKKLKGPLDNFIFEKVGRCIDCQKKWEARPENDPENNGYRIRFKQVSEDEVTIYAKSEEEAKEQFFEKYDEYENEIDFIQKIKIEKPKEPPIEKIVARQVGDPMVK
jgi:hypothetical protein